MGLWPGGLSYLSLAVAGPQWLPPPGAGVRHTVVMHLTPHVWWNTLHGAVLGGLFLVLIIATLAVLLQARAGGLTDAGARLLERWGKVSAIAMLAVGWTAVLTGTFLVDRWFGAQTSQSPAAVLRANGAGVWASTVIGVKEWASWASVVAASAAMIVLWRRRQGVVAGGRSPLILGLLGSALALASAGGLIGVLLTKFAPLV